MAFAKFERPRWFRDPQEVTLVDLKPEHLEVSGNKVRSLKKEGFEIVYRVVDMKSSAIPKDRKFRGQHFNKPAVQRLINPHLSMLDRLRGRKIEYKWIPDEATEDN